MIQCKPLVNGFEPPAVEIAYTAEGIYEVTYQVFKAGIAVGLCRLNQVDPWPITYSLSNS